MLSAISNVAVLPLRGIFVLVENIGNLLVDTFCVALLLISCILPWRLIEVLGGLEGLSKNKLEWLRFSLSNVCLTLFDFIAIPMGILSLFSPRIGVHVFMQNIYHYGTVDYWEVSQKKSWSIRIGFLKAFVGACFDYICFPIGFLSLCSPFRVYVIYKEFFGIIGRFLDYQNDLADWCDLDDWSELWNDFGFLFSTQGINAIGDVIVMLPCIAMLLVTPTLWTPAYQAVLKVLIERPNLIVDQDSRPVDPNSRHQQYEYRPILEQWNSVIFQIRLVFLVKFLHVIIEWLAFMFALLALVSPLRYSTFIGHLSPSVKSNIKTLKDYANKNSRSFQKKQQLLQRQVTRERMAAEERRKYYWNDYYRGGYDDYYDDGYGYDDDYEGYQMAEKHRKMGVSDSSHMMSLPPGGSRNQQWAAQQKGYNHHRLDPSMQYADHGEERENDGDHEHGSTTFDEKPSIQNPTDFHYHYAFRYRKACFKYGIASLMDLLLLPFFAPVFFTDYRMGPINAAISNKSDIFRLDEYLNVALQTFLLYTDFCFLPLICVVYLTRLRWYPLSTVLLHKDLSLKGTLNVYKTTVECFGVMILDIVCIPFAFLLVTTKYRGDQIKTIWFSYKLWYTGENSGFGSFYVHVATLVNFSIVVHDICILAPLTLLVSCFYYRTWHILHIFRRSRMLGLTWKIFFQKWSLENLYYALTSMDCFDRKTRRKAIRRRLDINHTEEHDPDDEYFDYLGNSTVSKNWREDLWVEIQGFFFDVLYLAFGLVVIGTHWRSKLLLDEFQNVLRDRREKDLVLFMLQKRMSKEEKETFERERRWPARKQFILLCKDILSLIPMVGIIVTFYRIPVCIYELFTWRACSCAISPELIVSDVKLTFPRAPGSNIVSDFEEEDRYIPPSHQPGSGAAHGPRLVVTAIRRALTAKEQDDLQTSSRASTNDLTHVLWNTSNMKATFQVIVTDELLESFIRTYPWLLYFRNLIGFRLVSKAIRLFYLPIFLGDNVDIGLSDLRRQITADGFDPVTDEVELWIQSQLAFSHNAALLTLAQLPADQVIAIQVELPKSVAVGNDSMVLFRLAITVGELEETILSGNSVNLSEEVFDIDGIRFEDSTVEYYKTTGNMKGYGREFLVDSFAQVSWYNGLRVLQDSTFILQCLLVLLTPWRARECYVALYEQPLFQRRLNVLDRCLQMMNFADHFLFEYRSSVMPVLNSVAKEGVNARLRNLFNYGHSRQLFNRSSHLVVPGSGLERKLCKLENTNLESYRQLSFHVYQLLSGYDGYTKILKLYEVRLRLQDCYMRHLSMKTVAHIEFHDGHFDEEKYALIICLIQESSDMLVKALKLCDDDLWYAVKDIEEYMVGLQEEFGADAQLSSGVFGSYESRDPYELTAKSCFLSTLVSELAHQSLVDLGFLLLGGLLLCSGIYTYTVGATLYNHSRKLKRYVFVNEYPVRQMILEFAMTARDDFFKFFKLLMLSVFNISSVVATPSYLFELPFHMQNIEMAIDCAKDHFRDAFFLILESLIQLTLWRNYVLLFHSVIASFIAPISAFAETNPWRFLAANIRIIVGCVVWGLLLLCASICTIAIYGIPPDPDDMYVGPAHYPLIVICFFLIMVLVFAIIYLQERVHYRYPSPSSTVNVSMSWSHILAAMTGPMESAQLCCVLVYYFWDPTKVGTDPHFGSSRLLLWTNPTFTIPESFQYLDYSIGLAMGLVGLWCVASAIPLTLNEATPEARRAKVAALAASPLYDSLHVVVTRLFSVWIMATLLRPFSCMYRMEAGWVMTTGPDISCGAGHNTLSYFILPALCFLMITQSLLNPATAELLHPSTAITSDGIPCYYGPRVRVAPLYSIGMRLFQFIILCFCAGGSTVYDAVLPLFIIASMACLMVMWSAAFRGEACSVPGMTTLRTVGAVGVLWTVFLLTCRRWFRAKIIPWFQSDEPLVHGWFVLMCVGAVLFMRDQYLYRKAWLNQFKEMETDHVATAMTDLMTYFVYKRSLLFGHSIKSLHVPTYDEMMENEKKSVNSEDENDDNVPLEKILEDLPKVKDVMTQVETSHTASKLAKLLVTFEESVTVNSLTNKFLQDRDSWKDSLINTSQLMDSVAFESYDSVLQSTEQLSEQLRTPTLTSAIAHEVAVLCHFQNLGRVVAWGIFGFLVDGDQLKGVLSRMTSNVMPLCQTVALESRAYHSNSCFLALHLQNAREELMKVMDDIESIDVIPPIIEEIVYYDEKEPVNPDGSYPPDTSISKFS